jgi:ABC-type branched-subunit amino acid transport system ATPase component
MLAIGRVLMSRLQLLPLDEPASGLTSSLVVSALETLEKVDKGGTPIVPAE